jgi:DnaJ homolog subfamily C member 8
MTHAEREAEVQRVLSAFKLDPFVIMGLSYEPTVREITRKYRKLSIMCHPDKARPETREAAGIAFARLAEAKKHLLDPEKRENLRQTVEECTAKVKADREAKEKAAERDYRKKNPNSTAKIRIQWPTPIEKAIQAEVKDILTFAEWRRRSYIKHAAEQEGQAEREKEAKQRELAERKKDTEDWEKNRTKRVSNWRQFQKGGRKRKRLPTKRSSAAATDRVVRPKPASKPNF